MASYKTLFRLHSDKIHEQAREEDVSGRGTMSKVQLIAALAEEDLSGLVEVLDQKKTELVDLAGDLDLDTGGTKDDLQIRIADARLSQSSRDGFPDSSRDGNTRKPDPELESSFETTEQRREAVMNGAAKAVAASLDKGRSFVLLESLLPRDARDPLSIQPAYMQHHPDKVLVLEVIVSQVMIEDMQGGAETDQAVKKAQEAAKSALVDGVSQVMTVGESGDEISVGASHRQREKTGRVVAEILVPHMAFRVHRAEQNPLRLWEQNESAEL
jgi:hypothetical protein